MADLREIGTKVARRVDGAAFVLFTLGEYAEELCPTCLNCLVNISKPDISCSAGKIIKDLYEPIRARFPIETFLCDKYSPASEKAIVRNKGNVYFLQEPPLMSLPSQKDDYSVWPKADIIIDDPQESKPTPPKISSKRNSIIQELVERTGDYAIDFERASLLHIIELYMQQGIALENCAPWASLLGYINKALHVGIEDWNNFTSQRSTPIFSRESHLAVDNFPNKQSPVKVALSWAEIALSQKSDLRMVFDWSVFTDFRGYKWQFHTSDLPNEAQIGTYRFQLREKKYEDGSILYVPVNDIVFGEYYDGQVWASLGIYNPKGRQEVITYQINDDEKTQWTRISDYLDFARQRFIR